MYKRRYLSLLDNYTAASLRALRSPDRNKIIWNAPLTILKKGRLEEITYEITEYDAAFWIKAIFSKFELIANMKRALVKANTEPRTESPLGAPPGCHAIDENLLAIQAMLGENVPSVSGVIPSWLAGLIYEHLDACDPSPSSSSNQ